MDYEKKYKEALERAREIHNERRAQCFDVMVKVFPELKESKDERIRKKVIDVLKLNVKGAESQMQASRGVDRTFEIYACNKVIAWLEKQDEQKPDNKVQPKFKVGDWVVYNRNDHSREIMQIYDIRDGRYYFNDNVHFSWSIKECDEKSHLWTIQDAKDGDVLEFEDHKRIVVGIVSFVNERTGKVDVSCLLEDNKFKNGNFYALDTIKPHPATKEQRDLLFQGMKEAGYEWDFEKKELKKSEQKYDWSEEDEKMFRNIRCYLNEFGNWLSTINEEKSLSVYKTCDWLNSLKERIKEK